MFSGICEMKDEKSLMPSGTQVFARDGAASGAGLHGAADLVGGEGVVLLGSRPTCSRVSPRRSRRGRPYTGPVGGEPEEVLRRITQGGLLDARVPLTNVTSGCYTTPRRSRPGSRPARAGSPAARTPGGHTPRRDGWPLAPPRRPSGAPSPERADDERGPGTARSRSDAGVTTHPPGASEVEFSAVDTFSVQLRIIRSNYV